MKKRALTLIEVCITALVLVILASGFLYFHSYVMKTCSLMSNIEIALGAIKSEMVSLEIASYGDVINGTFDVVDAESAPIPDFAGKRTVSVIGTDEAKDVNLTVQYTGASDLPIGPSCGPGCSQISVTVIKLNKG